MAVLIVRRGTFRSEAVGSSPDGEGSPLVLDVQIPGGVEAARSAREVLEGVRPRLAPAVHHDLRLLVSELVTNAVRHADSKAPHMRVTCRPGRVRVEVGDEGHAFETPSPRPSPGGEAGWGLFLVDRVASRWGVEDRPKTVWFEIDQPPPRRRALRGPRRGGRQPRTAC